MKNIWKTGKLHLWERCGPEVAKTVVLLEPVLLFDLPFLTVLVQQIIENKQIDH
jgi:hypothetical protein